MTRVQVYLDETHINILDWLAVQAGVSRSQALRQTIITVGKKVAKKPKTNPLLQFIGAGRATKNNVAENIDEIYLRD